MFEVNTANGQFEVVQKHERYSDTLVDTFYSEDDALKCVNERNENIKKKIGYTSYDWKEAFELKNLSELLKPFGLKCLSVENGDAYEFMVYGEEITGDDLAMRLQAQYSNFEMTPEEAKEMFVYPVE